MFVHTGASLHGHEYSLPAQQNNTTPTRVSSPRTAFSSSPQRRLALLGNPTTQQKPSVLEAPAPIIRRPGRSTSSSTRIFDHVRFQDQELGIMGANLQLISSPDRPNDRFDRKFDGSNGTEKQSAKFRVPIMTYHFTYPARKPQPIPYLNIRPHLLLQVQLGANPRPKPVLDIQPSSKLVTPIAMKFPRMFKGRTALGPNDLVVYESEEYDKGPEGTPFNADTSQEEYSQSQKVPVAVICQAHKNSGVGLGTAEICFSDESEWIATPVTQDLFEFSMTDVEGLTTTARWRRKGRRSKGVTSIRSVEGPDDAVFTFCVVDPNSGTRPVLATLSLNKLDIPLYYAPATASLRHSTKNRAPSEEIEPFGERLIGSDTLTGVVDAKMQLFIQVTAIWVAMRRKWGVPSFEYNDEISLTPNGSMRSRVTSDAGNDTSPGRSHRSTTSDISSQDKTAQKNKRQTIQGIPSYQSPSLDGNSNRPQRRISSGSAFMQRKASRQSYPSKSHGSGEEAMPAVLRRAVTDFGDPIAKRVELETNGQSSLDFSPNPTHHQEQPHSMNAPKYGSRADMNGNSLNHVANGTDKESGSRVESTDFGTYEALSQTGNDRKQKLSKWKSFSGLFKKGTGH